MGLFFERRGQIIVKSQRCSHPHIIISLSNDVMMRLSGTTLWDRGETPCDERIERREGDSNPRGREARWFSRPVQSSALPSLQLARILEGPWKGARQ